MRRMSGMLGVISLVGMAMTAVAADAPSAAAPGAAAPAELSLTRFDCGKTSPLTDQGLARFSDINAFKGLSVQLTFSCYLIKHGGDYMIWDTGNPAATVNCSFRFSRHEKINMPPKGGTVTIKGKCAGFLNDVNVVDCVLE